MCYRCDERAATPFRPPTCTVKQLKAAIPARLFHRSTQTSFLYLAQDIAMALLLSVAVRKADVYCTSVSSDLMIGVLRWTTWLAYWLLQSLVFTGLWVIAHECGHEAFSQSKTICNLTGFIIHTALGAPYFSWKYSHTHHHSYNANIEMDEHFIPESRTSPIVPDPNSSWGTLVNAFEDSPIYQIIALTVRQLIGFQVYLATNVTGQPRYPRFTNHYNPYAVLFKPQQFWGVVLSDIGMLSLMAALWTASKAFGFAFVARIYIVPWFLMSHWILMIVYLHHADMALPLYRPAEWTYSRGVLTTMDRELFGWVGVFFLHNISHCHIVHHIDSKIPFYHTPEATEYIKKVLGDDYSFCETPAFLALWNSYKNCRYVDRDENILFYRNKHGEQQRSLAQPLKGIS